MYTYNESKIHLLLLLLLTQSPHRYHMLLHFSHILDLFSMLLEPGVQGIADYNIIVLLGNFTLSYGD